MAKKETGKTEKALKPSQRESLTGFSARFGTEPTYEEKRRKQRIRNGLLIALGVLLLIAIGFYVTDVLIQITELPLQEF